MQQSTLFPQQSISPLQHNLSSRQCQLLYNNQLSRQQYFNLIVMRDIMQQYNLQHAMQIGLKGYEK